MDSVLMQKMSSFSGTGWSRVTDQVLYLTFIVQKWVLWWTCHLFSVMTEMTRHVHHKIAIQDLDILPYSYTTIINFFVYIKIVCKLTVYLTWWSLELQTSAASSVMLHDKHHFHSVWLKRKWMTNLKRKGCLYTCTWKHIAFLSRSVARKLKWVVFFRLHPFLVHEP